MFILSRLFLIIIFFLSCKNVIANPVIFPLPNNNIASNQMVVIEGERLSENNLAIEWLGGINGNIELGDVDSKFQKEKWSPDSDNTGFHAPRYTNAKSHSGSKSIVSQYPQQSVWGSGFSYNHGTPFGEIYVTWWVYFEHFDSQGQWKKWRLSPTGSYGDTNGEIMQSDWYNTLGATLQTYVMIFCDYQNYSQCYPEGNDSYRWMGKTVPVGRWVRLELYTKQSSLAGIPDGTFIYNMYTQEDTVIQLKNYQSSVTTRIKDNEKWQYFQFQNYWGNISGGDGTKEKIYIDDVYLQMGCGQARIEIGDNKDWNLCKHREIQFPTKWSNNLIAFNVNRGSFNVGDTAYLFVVDVNGVSSEGQEIMFNDDFQCEGFEAPGSVKIEVF